MGLGHVDYHILEASSIYNEGLLWLLFCSIFWQNPKKVQMEPLHFLMVEIQLFWKLWHVLLLMICSRNAS